MKIFLLFLFSASLFASLSTNFNFGLDSPGSSVESVIDSQTNSTTNDTWLLPSNPDRYSAQQFVVSSEISVAALKIRHFDNDAIAGTYDLAIQADSAGNPSGTDIVSGTFNAADLNDGSAPPSRQRFDFSSTAVLSPATYWFVARGTGLTGTGQVKITFDSTNPRGDILFKLSTNAGVSWTSASLDLEFEVIGVTGSGAGDTLSSSGFGF